MLRGAVLGTNWGLLLREAFANAALLRDVNFFLFCLLFRLFQVPHAELVTKVGFGKFRVIIP